MRREYVILFVTLFALFMLGGCTSLKKGQTNNLNDLVVNDYPGLSMELADITPIGATCNLKNSSNADFIYGTRYRIQEYREEEWYYREATETDKQGHVITWTDESYDLPAYSERAIDHNWAVIYGKLPPGKYRIIKEIIQTFEDKPFVTQYVSCEFEIAE